MAASKAIQVVDGRGVFFYCDDGYEDGTKLLGSVDQSEPVWTIEGRLPGELAFVEIKILEAWR